MNAFSRTAALLAAAVALAWAPVAIAQEPAGDDVGMRDVEPSV
jgi:hypothetical protein